MDEKTIHTTLDTLAEVVQELYAMRNDVRVYTFTGTLGAGKTTLIRRLLQEWGINQPVTSPTFTYVNIYQTAHKEILYHFDLYRLNSLDQFIEPGFDEFLYRDNSWAFIEWPAIITPILTRNVCDVVIDYVDETTRKVSYGSKC